MYLQVGRAIIPHMGVKKAYELTVRRRGVRRAVHDPPRPRHLGRGLLGVRLGFDSIMFDAAHLPFEENIKATRRVVELCHDYGIPVEAELGKIPDVGDEVEWASYYTDVAEAERFVAETGVDLLAISAGVVHGVTAVHPQPLAIDLIRDIRDVVPVPLVLHGVSGVPDDEVKDAIANGVDKLNGDTDLRHAFRAGLEETWSKGDRQLEEVLDAGRERMIDATVEKLELFGCAGRSKDAGMTAAEAPAGTTTPLTGIRKIAARRMVEAWAAPVFHLSVNVDMSAVLAPGTARPAPPSPTRCSRPAAALRAHPAMNAHCDGNVVTTFGDVNIGLAVATDKGLTVPVLHGAQALDLSGFAAARRDVVDRARTGKLARADISDGTFTVSNLGMLGIDQFDAILNPPQVAILAVGSTKQRQVWNDGDPAWRPIAEMTLTCDHRAVDGAAGAGFLATLRDHLQA